MHSVTDRQTNDRMMPIADHTVLQYDRLKTNTLVWARFLCFMHFRIVQRSRIDLFALLHNKTWRVVSGAGHKPQQGCWRRRTRLEKLLIIVVAVLLLVLIVLVIISAVHAGMSWLSRMRRCLCVYLCQSTSVIATTCQTKFMFVSW